MAKGLRQRWENLPTDTPPGAGCPPNRWKEYRASQTLPTDADKRYITLVIANYGAFERNGITELPITKFGGFYATGWYIGGGNPGTHGCPSLTAPVSNDLPPPVQRGRTTLQATLVAIQAHKSSKERSGDTSSRRSFRHHSAGRASRRAFSPNWVRASPCLSSEPCRLQWSATRKHPRPRPSRIASGADHRPGRMMWCLHVEASM